jgi:hypothetical protein
MSQKHLFVFVLLLIVVSGCLDQQRVTGPVAEEKKAGCEQVQSQDMRIVCYLNLAYELKDPGICDKIADRKNKELCLGRVGVATGDASLCNRMSNLTLRMQCLYAVERKNP